MPPTILRHAPWWGALALLAAIWLHPPIEIGLSALFFEPERRIFPFRVAPLGEFVRKVLPALLFALAAVVAVLGAAAAWRRRPLLGIGPRLALYLLATLAVGPGLVVNTVFKDNWGRPRPSTIAEFSGPNTYVPPLLPSRQCDDNCSFPSGHAALGFWAVAFALVAPLRWRRPAVVAALGFGGLVGLARIAQGGHFLSDVVMSGLIVTATALVLRRVIVERPPA